MENEVGPYWRATSEWLAREAPEVMVCLEMHPGRHDLQRRRLRGARGLDRAATSASTWIRVISGGRASIRSPSSRRFGPRIGWAHGKDTLLYPDRIRRHGVLHFAPPTEPDKAPWHFAPVGEGHDDGTWTAIVAALRAVGYDDVISIEHEDPRYDGEEGTTAPWRV